MEDKSAGLQRPSLRLAVGKFDAHLVQQHVAAGQASAIGHVVVVGPEAVVVAVHGRGRNHVQGVEYQDDIAVDIAQNCIDFAPAVESEAILMRAQALPLLGIGRQRDGLLGPLWPER